MKVWPGQPYPLGATFDGSGTNFSLSSEHAERVELYLFDESGTETRAELSDVTIYCWHAYLPIIGPDQRYGYRVHGPWDPVVFPYQFDENPEARSETDTAPFVPKSAVQQAILIFPLAHRYPDIGHF